MPELEIKRKAEEYAVVPAKKTRHEISVVGTREKAVVTATVCFSYILKNSIICHSYQSMFHIHTIKNFTLIKLYTSFHPR